MTTHDDNFNFLKSNPIFQDLPDEALDAIARSLQHRVVHQRTILFNEGDPGDTYYIIRSGRVRLFRKNDQGMEIDITIQEPPEAFGEIALLTGEPRGAYAEALGETHLMVLTKEDFDRILGQFPVITKVFVKEMRSWLIENEDRRHMEVAEEVKATKLSWLDFAVVLAVSVILAVVFNTSNPNGVALFPAFPDASAIPAVTPAAAKAAVEQNGALILDASPTNFYEKSHIQGAVNVPLALFDIVSMMTFSEEDKDRKIIVYGRTLSKLNDLEVANKLLLRGFKDVTVLDGGLTAWKQMQFPVEEKAKP